jgi:hypothetical protein
MAVRVVVGPERAIDSVLSARKMPMTANQAMAFVRDHGVVLASAKGPVPRLTEAIVGERIKGTWWAHPKSHQIFAVLQSVSSSEDILVCRVVGAKITLVHRRLWPALVRVATRFEPSQIAQVRDQHTPSGRHVSLEVAFPKWVPPDVGKKAEHIAEQDALAALGPWTLSVKPPIKATRRAPHVL